MGTRSLTAFIQRGRESKEFATMYRQFDGYPEGHGLQLAEFICSGEQVNGIYVERTYNGIGCLAAQIVAHFKPIKSGIYLEPPGARDVGEEYVYEVYVNQDGTVRISCYDTCAKKTIFVGTPEKFIAKYKVKETA